MIQIIWSTTDAQDLDEIISSILDKHSTQHAETFVDAIESDRDLVHAVIDGRRNIEDILLRRNIR